MTNLVNLDRDMYWSNYADPVAFSGGDLAAAALVVGNSGAVGQRVSAARSTGVTVSAASGLSCSSFGVLMLPPPDGDRVPYRVKGAFLNNSSNPVAWGYGLLDGGTGSSVVLHTVFSAGYSCDEIVLIEPLADSHPNFGDPLCFFASVVRKVASTSLGSLSVQRLISKPDQYASAVS